MKTNPTGFSFTTMLFGPFPVLLRGDWQMALVLIAIWLGSMIPVLGWLVLPFLFLAPAMVNRLYQERQDTGTCKPFPLHEFEGRNAVLYALFCVMVFLVIGCSAAAVLMNA